MGKQDLIIMLGNCSAATLVGIVITVVMMVTKPQQQVFHERIGDVMQIGDRY